MTIKAVLFVKLKQWSEIARRKFVKICFTFFHRSSLCAQFDYELSTLHLWQCFYHISANYQKVISKIYIHLWHFSLKWSAIFINLGGHKAGPCGQSGQLTHKVAVRFFFFKAGLHFPPYFDSEKSKQSILCVKLKRMIICKHQFIFFVCNLCKAS